MSPFYAAYLRQLLPNKPGYASGGTVQPGVINKAGNLQTQNNVTPTAADTQAPGLGGPTQLQSGDTGASNMANAHGRLMETGTSGTMGKNGEWLDPGGKLKIGPNVAGMTNTILDALSNKFQAQAAPIQAGTNVKQLDTAYNQAQSGITQQQQLANQLGAQGGIQNQSNVYDQFGNIAQGQGPNPALEMLQQQTGNNIAQQGALMASQRGASANPAAIARQVAQQGAATQQNAVGQAAALQAQQSLNALGNQGNIAGQQVANQMAGVQGVNNAVQNEQNILQGANTAHNNAMVNMQGGMNSANAQAAAGNQQAAGQVAGGIMKGVSSVASMFSDEQGKKNFESANFDIDEFLDSLHKPNMAEGGEVEDEESAPEPQVDAPAMSAPVMVQPAQSGVGDWLSSNVDSGGGSTAAETAQTQALDWDFSMGMGGGGGGGGGGMMGGMGMARGGVVAPQMSSPVTVSGPQSAAGQWLTSNIDAGGGSQAAETAAVAPLKWDLGGGGGGKKKSGGGNPMNNEASMASGVRPSGNSQSLQGGIGLAKGGEIEDTAEPKSYDYKNPDQPGAAEGRQYGITAQDLEKSKAGASVVQDTPQGKMVDSTHAIGLLLASVGRLNERIKELEGEHKRMAQGGKVDAMVSPGERYLDKEDVQKVKKGMSPRSVGRVIPGKPRVGGTADTEKNDTVPKKLQVGGAVIPRSVEQAPDADGKAQAFIEAVFMHKPKLKKKK